MRYAQRGWHAVGSDEQRAARGDPQPSRRDGHYQFDLPAYVAHRLRQSGIGRVETMPACTYREEAKYFSYRRTTHRKEADYGRQLSAIALTD